jgi:hypothetical protein
MTTKKYPMDDAFCVILQVCTGVRVCVGVCTSEQSKKQGAAAFGSSAVTYTAAEAPRECAKQRRTARLQFLALPRLHTDKHLLGLHRRNPDIQSMARHGAKTICSRVANLQCMRAVEH